MSYVLALDAGTTQIKVALFGHDGTICAISERKVDVYFPTHGYVEQDPLQIYTATIEAIKDTLNKAGVNSDEVVSLGITNQRINVLMWDVKTGQPIYNAMGWQDLRGPDKTPGLMARNSVEFTLASLVVGKILWLFERFPDLRNKTESGEVVFGGIDTWLLWKLTGGKIHATDVSNASTTILYDIQKMCWNTELLSEVNVPLNIFPQVLESGQLFGHVSTPDLELNCPIAALVADQQASLFGHRCFETNQAKVTMGTGCFVMVNMGQNLDKPPFGIIKHIAWSINDQQTIAMEGSILSSGSALEWLKDGLGLISSLDDLELLASSVEDSGGVFFVPALTGLGSPSWDTKARGLLIGLDRGTQKGHIAKAAIESLAFQIREVMDAMYPAFLNTQTLCVDGKPTTNKLLIQTLADVCQMKVERKSNYNLSLTGAAYLAGLASGFWSTPAEISQFPVETEVFYPQHNREHDYIKWLEAVKRSQSWLD